MTCPPKLLSLLRDPVGKEPLAVDGTDLVNRTNGRRYPITDGIPTLISPAELGPQNTKLRRMYDRLAPLYDLGLTLGNFFSRGKLTALRRRIATLVALKPGDRLLYTSVGTGADLRFLAEQVDLKSIEWIGLDLSRGMLRRCRARLRSLGGTGLLVQANAECLPLADRSFDVVLQVGGINFFDHPAAAAEEMVRVAKEGARILIADETNKVVRQSYRKNPLTRAYFQDTPDAADPRHWVPPGAREVHYEEVFDGRGYLLSFRPPAS